ncbi:hypothetical protein N0V82_010891, partial [Gnomoniopsis sp. IMI 355080]
PAAAPTTYPQISESTCPGVRLIRRWYLKARLDCGPFWTAERVAEAFTGVDELTVEVWQSMYGEGGGKVLRLFRGVRGVKRVKIWGSTTGLERYVRWLEGVMGSPEGTEVEPFDAEWPSYAGGETEKRVVNVESTRCDILMKKTPI